MPPPASALPPFPQSLSAYRATVTTSTSIGPATAALSASPTALSSRLAPSGPLSLSTMQSAIQQITHNLPPFLQRPLIGLIGQECYTTLVYNVDLSSTRCIRLAVSKGLGLGIIVFGSVMKLPQILNILTARSARGVSLTMYALEVVAYTISLAYAVRGRLPFSTYGENLSLTLQNMIITLLVIAYSPLSPNGRVDPPSKLRPILLSALAMALGTTALFHPSLVPAPLLTLLQATTIPISLASKVPQMLSLHRTKSRGQLSAIVVFAQLLGTVARVFTTLTETDDRLLFYGFALATVFNAVIAGQVLVYWSAGESAALPDSVGMGKYPGGKPSGSSHPISVAAHGENVRRSARKLD